MDAMVLHIMQHLNFCECALVLGLLFSDWCLRFYFSDGNRTYTDNNICSCTHISDDSLYVCITLGSICEAYP
jgi:hypothetical protein